MTKARDFIGPYRLARLIRQGSTCAVWEAIQEGDENRVALKVLRDDKRGNKAEIALLKHEYEIGSQLKSNRVIRVDKFEVDKGTAYLVLELFSELNLKQALRRGPEGIAFLAEKIIEQAAEGLYFMHTKGFIHKDIKPDNYLVSREGQVKLIDFTIAEKKKTGISKLFGKTKAIKGTRSYMSPEQIRGKALDERADIYSFGCVLYELVTGKPPFTGDSPNDLLNKHLTAPIPSPAVQNDNVTQEFADLVRQMLSKKPDDRPSSMWEFLKSFRALKTFKKVPRKPDVDIFSEETSFKNPEQLLRTD